MKNLLEISDEIVLTIDKIDKAAFIINDIQEDVFGGYKEPNMASGKPGNVRGSVYLETVHDYLCAALKQLESVNDMLKNEPSLNRRAS